MTFPIPMPGVPPVGAHPLDGLVAPRGDASGMAVLARRHAGAAERLDALAGQVDGGVGKLLGQPWDGESAVACSAACLHLHAAIRRAAEGHRVAGSALGRYAAVLNQAQHAYQHAETTAAAAMQEEAQRAAANPLPGAMLPPIPGLWPVDPAPGRAASRQLAHVALADVQAAGDVAAAALHALSAPLVPAVPPPPQQHHSGWIKALAGAGLAVGGVVIAATTVVNAVQAGLDPATDGLEVGEVAGEDALLSVVTDAGADGGATAVADGAVDVAAQSGDAGAWEQPLSALERQRSRDWLAEQDVRPEPRQGPAYDYQRDVAGDLVKIRDGDVSLDADGYLADEGYTVEAKYAGKPGRSPFVDGSEAPSFLRDQVSRDLRSELERTQQLINSGSNPIRAVVIRVNDPAAVSWATRILQEVGVPGRVEVVPAGGG